MATSSIVHLQIFKRLQRFSFSTDLDETGIKINGSSRSFIYNLVIVWVAVPFNRFNQTGAKNVIFYLSYDINLIL